MTDETIGWTTLGNLDDADSATGTVQRRTIKPPGRFGRFKRSGSGRYFRLTVRPDGTVIRQTSADGMFWRDDISPS